MSSGSSSETVVKLQGPYPGLQGSGVGSMNRCSLSMVPVVSLSSRKCQLDIVLLGVNYNNNLSNDVIQ